MTMTMMRKPVILQDVSNSLTADERLELEALRRENLKLKQKGSALKVSEKGAVSLYGNGRFPVTMYAEQWLKVLDQAETIRAFIEANKASLSWKD